MEPSRDSRGIVRLDQPKTGTYGWQVRLQRGGVKFARYFADRAAGGPEAAFVLACAWRDELLERFAREIAQARVCRTSARNSSGVVGVSRIAIQVPSGAVYFFWQASWSPSPGTRRSIRFSVKRYGEKQAFRLAVEARRDATGL